MRPQYADVTAEHTRTNFYAQLVPGQTILQIPHYPLECGESLSNFPVAYKTWGRLNASRDNVLLIQHALTGLCDVQDWWGPLLGTGRTFDPSRFFIVCINMLGSPYGSCSPVSIDAATGRPYGPLFPLCTAKDDLGVQKLVLDHLGVQLIACVIGGSMGGMIAMEYSLTYNNSPYLKSVIALATSARALAWCISWNEAQRQCIFSDPYYDDGYYFEGNLRPNLGLSAARMSALLTYRLRNSFEARFGRKLPASSGKRPPTRPEDRNSAETSSSSSPSQNPLTHNDLASTASVNNESPANADSATCASKINADTTTPANERNADPNSEPKIVSTDRGDHGAHNAGSGSLCSAAKSPSPSPKPQTNFTAQSYLRYQGTKFVNRFDANCYIAMTRKLDTHDITRGQIDPPADPSYDPLPDYLRTLHKPHLVVGISSDGLFTYGEQEMLGECLPDAILKRLELPEGHDAFLIEFEVIDTYCLNFLKSRHPDIYDDSTGKVDVFHDWADFVKTLDSNEESVFGASEQIITNW